MSRTAGDSRHSPRPLMVALSALLPLACLSSDREKPSESVKAISSALVITGALEADSYVNSKKPTTNFGTQTGIKADSAAAGGILEGYVRFTLGAGAISSR